VERRVRRPALFVFALLALLADGCGEEAERERGAEARPAPRAITEADSGESFTLAPGSGTSLRLSGDYDWSEPAVRGEAVQLARVDYFQDPGFSEWTVVAAAPGTATISARGTGASTPLRFQVRIIVAP
jgi:hypothetical protein